MIGVVDYGMGNLLSVYNALYYIGADVMFCKNPDDLEHVERIVIPGVGAFKDCISKLNSTGFVEALHSHVIKRGKPTMGICLGMQLMGNRSFEGGEFEGLGWFDADVVKLSPSDPNLRIPNIGWNSVDFDTNCPLFKGIPARSDFYLVHSYYMKVHDVSDVVATYDYTYPVTAAVKKNNIFATQFHPEKSQDYGLKILENFIEWRP